MRFPTPSLRLTPALLLAALLAVVPAQAATITVDSPTDDGTGGCTLREAVESANTDTAVGGCVAGDDSDDTVNFNPGFTFFQLLSQITITEELTLTGNGTTISGAAGDRVFEITSDEDVAFNDLVITSAGSTSASGYPTNGGGVLISGLARLTATNTVFSNHIVSGSGGAIWVSDGGALNAVTSTFTGNRARGDASDQGGGGIYSNAGVLFIQGSTFTDNRALGTSGSGGAISSPNNADVDIESSTFTNNRAQRAGGGIEIVGGTVSILDSQFTGNNAGANPGNGGAVHIAGGATVTVSGFGGPSSVDGNRAQEGGGLWVGGSATLTVVDTDVTGNFADGASSDQGGGGLYNDGATLFVTNSTISDNRAPGASGSGGGIFVNDGAATITGTTISGNVATRAGGGVETLSQSSVTLNEGTTLTGNATGNAPGNGGGLHMTGNGFVTLDGATVSGNRAANEGGGLWASGNGALDVLRTEVVDNRAEFGGGLFQQAFSEPPPPSGATAGKPGRSAEMQAKSGLIFGAFVGESLIYANTARFGGGVYADGPATFINTTIAGNEARFGGGVFSDEAFLTFDSATIARNTARTSGGGLYNTDPNNGGERFVAFTNTIVAENTAPANGPDLQGRYASEDYNLISTTPSAATFAPEPNDQLGADPLLGMLADNGGPTRTLALGAGSPAIDAGSTIRTVDQRGEPRSDGTDDIGAYEAAAAPMAALVITGVFDGDRSGGLPKGVEIYVLEDIADLSAYGLGSANNGGGTDGQEFTFPADAATAGDFVYVASEIPNFNAFFGFDPDYTSGAMAINGDDAVELFFDGAVVDVYGEQGTNGDGEPWDYTDGWGYREDGTGPDGGSFAVGNWSYAFNGLDGALTNAAAPSPFPIGTYSPVVTAGRTAPALATAAEPVRLGAVTPNPFALRATTSFSVAQAQAVTVSLYDVTGRRVQTLYTGTAQAASPVQVSVDAGALASGVYVLVLEGETVRTTRPVTVAR